MMNSCQQKTKADLLLFNGIIYTVDSMFSNAEAMAVKDGKIIATGSSNDLMNNYDADSTIDLQGKFVYPGFIDAHCHFYGLALMLQQADLFGLRSFEDIIERLNFHRMTYKPQWLLGRGWDQNLWDNKEMPDNEFLNDIFPDIPVAITRVDGHAVLANSKALEMAGITSATVIEGGKIVIKDGKLTGLLLDKAADKMKDMVPKPVGDELIELIRESQERCLGCGLTTVADAGLTEEVVKILEQLQADSILKINVYVMLDPSDVNIEHFVKKGIYRKDRVHAGAIKLYADGALGSRGACLLKPYSDDEENSGLMAESEETLREFCRTAYDNNYQVCTHAIGDSAVRTVLEIYAEILGGKNDRRWRIEHSQVVDEADFTTYGQYSIIPSVQPTHATSDMYWATDRLGSERVKNSYAYKKLMQQNGWLPLGTDFPIEKTDPLLTFYAAVFRRDLKGYPESGFQPENAVSREEALKGITIWAAKGGFEENEKGSLEAGKYADFVILDKDIMTVSEKEIPGTKILKTYIRGEKVFDITKVSEK